MVTLAELPLSELGEIFQSSSQESIARVREQVNQALAEAQAKFQQTQSLIGGFGTGSAEQLASFQPTVFSTIEEAQSLLQPSQRDFFQEALTEFTGSERFAEEQRERIEGVQTSAAARGLLRSGRTLREVANVPTQLIQEQVAPAAQALAEEDAQRRALAFQQRQQLIQNQLQADQLRLQQIQGAAGIQSQLLGALGGLSAGFGQQQAGLLSAQGQNVAQGLLSGATGLTLNQLQGFIR